MRHLKTLFILTIALLLSTVNLSAQEQSDLTYKAYLINSKHLWEQSLNANHETDLQKALSYYGLLNNTMATEDEETFDEYYDEAIDYLDQLIENNEHTAEAYALKSSIYGFKMGYSPWMGIVYGPKSGAAMDKAMNLKPDSPIVQMVKGLSDYYTPSAFGGDKEKALESFQRAHDLFESEQYKGWMYLQNLAMLGKAHASLSQKELAKEKFELALNVEPDFKWVSEVLLPNLEK